MGQPEGVAGLSPGQPGVAKGNDGCRTWWGTPVWPRQLRVRVLKTWIAEGARGPGGSKPDAVRIVGLDVFPRERTYRVGQTQQLRVVARYADGHRNDVTRRSAFDSLESGIADVGDDGRVTVSGSGQAAVMVRYRGQTAVAHVMSPFATTGSTAVLPKTGNC
ncbi:MAG: hypothetical protein Ct9H300mP1_33870 [Planctomycetaceae bacterium]|nr:MAG: hypothetical protein Ct9H300mP1_33870 [Planctomycetaceae bacterium]